MHSLNWLSPLQRKEYKPAPRHPEKQLVLTPEVCAQIREMRRTMNYPQIAKALNLGLATVWRGERK